MTKKCRTCKGNNNDDAIRCIWCKNSLDKKVKSKQTDLVENFKFPDIRNKLKLGENKNG